MKSTFSFARIAITASLLIAVVLLPSSLQASTYAFTFDGCSGTCGGGPYGSASVVQDADGKSLDISVVLAANVGLVQTGSHTTFVFSLASDPSITISGINNFSQFTLLSSTSGHSYSESSAGNFDYGFNCTGSHGSSNPCGGPFSFKVTDTGVTLTPSSIIAGTDGYFFGEDIVGPNGNTGPIGATLSATPLPAAWPMFVTGLGLIAFVAFQKKRKSNSK